ncbi:long-chain fatty acid--CoA ligase [Myxococcota bacterium]|nr:long-chain fatty acid--CoA ligase [Myxococcota bacterium]
MFLHRVASTPDSEALCSPSGEGAAWRSITWQEAGDRARDIAAGLLALGMQQGERCALLSETRVEWILADMAILSAGAVTAAIYPQATPEDRVFILADSESRVVFTENAEQTAVVEAARARLPHLHRVVQIVPGGEAAHDLDPAQARPFVVTLAALEEAGRAWLRLHPGAWEARARAVGSQDLATLIYTSGTTGQPKGVELTHDAWVSVGDGIDALGIMSPADRQLLFLPLAHSFARVMEIAAIRIGIVTAVDGRRDHLGQNLAQVKPTFMAVVPRVLEKLHARIVRHAHEAGRASRSVFRWSMRVGEQATRARVEGRRPDRGLRLREGLADRLVFRQIQHSLGGRLRFVVSGAAPLSPELALFFSAAGVQVLEGYGLTESSAASFVNRPDRCRPGTVGQAMPGVEVRIDAHDGEILLRGRGIMRGYHGLPRDTAQVLTPDGWLRTGDIGQLDADGFLSITDRKKDLIKTSGGKYVAPQPIEERLKAGSPWVSQVLVHGDRRPWVTALITLDEAHARGWARGRGLGGLDLPALTRHADVLAELQAVVDRLNATLAPHEQVRSFALLPEELTVEHGDLTPTLKIRRRAVEARYRALLDGFYPRWDEARPGPG